MGTRSLLATLVGVFVLAACTEAPAAEPAGATCDQFASTPAIEQSRTIEAGADLTVVLCSNASTGFAWGDPEIGDPAVLRLVDRTFREPEASPPIVGAPGTEILTIRGVAAGTTTLTTSYDQPWAGGTKGEWTYTLDVIVR